MDSYWNNRIKTTKVVIELAKEMKGIQSKGNDKDNMDHLDNRDKGIPGRQQANQSHKKDNERNKNKGDHTPAGIMGTKKIKLS